MYYLIFPHDPGKYPTVQWECACTSILTIVKNAICLCAHCVHEHAQNELSLLPCGCPPPNKILHKFSFELVHLQPS